ncbi:MarR family winged helix-turn-helix transcriptional regulator [Agrilactobacillus yilanensis]|uniref:HTH-type transcriptional regulator SarZ n=1 Tax=Agrilactobacillus yilanensis TaxID=2485997 RepID=A0ABW4J7M4_9LACO|nr:MarR family transcriptional regulator [Agrilactobacillus yilanensis]
MDKEIYERINEKLVRGYRDISNIEEKELRKGPFHDLSIKELHTINAITMYHHKTSSQVSQEMRVTPGTLTAAINNLARKGYVQRLREKTDRRVIRLGLTRKGRSAYRLHDSFHRKMVMSFLDGFNKDEISLIEHAVDNLIEFLEDKNHAAKQGPSERDGMQSC